MKRLIRHVSSRFGHRIAQYSYPELRPERPRVSQREPTAEELEPRRESPDIDEGETPDRAA